MFDISSAKVLKVVVHRVGNKFRDEGVHLSPDESSRSIALEELLLKSFLAPVIRKGQQYELFHESDLNLNTVNHYSSMVFKDNDSFHSSSEALAKHLYSSSTHPNIGGGEFFIILFDDVRVDNSSFQAIGLFRVENKNDYLDVREEHGAISVIEKSGISLDKVQKGAIILAESSQVFVVDSLGQKTKYWIDSFLKVVTSQTPQVCAKVAGAFLKAISNKVESASDALEFGSRVNERLSKSDVLTVADIREISNSFIRTDEVNELLEGVRLKHGLHLEDDLLVESKKLSKYAKEVVTKTRIADGVNLIVSNPYTKIHSIDIKRTRSGYQAVVDIETKED